jgi:hypothetical protein
MEKQPTKKQPPLRFSIMSRLEISKIVLRGHQKCASTAILNDVPTSVFFSLFCLRREAQS